MQELKHNSRPALFMLVVILFWTINALGPYHPVTPANAQAQADLTDVFLPVALNSRPPSANTYPYRTVNAINYPDNEYSFHRSSIFWFGKVTSSQNYADVRVGYTDTVLYIALNIMDRYLWYDQSPSSQDLENWDAVTLYLSTSEDPGSQPGPSETKWIAQLNHWQPREDYQAVLVGNGAGWTATSLPFTTESEWRGEGLNDNTHPDAEDKGWLIAYHIPFSSLGITSPPHGATFRLAIALHDRDSATGSILQDQVWPESANYTNPTSWGGLHLGLPVFQSPGSAPTTTTIIRNGSQGVVVKDAHVGGAFDCGASVGYDWDRWGNTNYELVDSSKINIQNQRDVSDWPCFSKYFITFPLDQIPPTARIVSASLTMFHFGNSSPLEAYPSNIQVLSVNEDWGDTTITWNNAPMAWTNYTRTRVEPLLSYPGWPGIPIMWDVSQVVQDAINQNTPLRLALYSSDDPMHSGKYFFSSDSGGSDLSARPYLTIQWAYP